MDVLLIMEGENTRKEELQRPHLFFECIIVTEAFYELTNPSQQITAHVYDGKENIAFCFAIGAFPLETALTAFIIARHPLPPMNRASHAFPASNARVGCSL